VAAAASTANAVDIGVEHDGEVEVDDSGDFRDVEAAGSDVGGDQDLDFVSLEGAQSVLALRLRNASKAFSGIYVSMKTRK